MSKYNKLNRTYDKIETAIRTVLAGAGTDYKQQQAYYKARDFIRSQGTPIVKEVKESELIK